ncbi:MAG: DNA repair protein RadC, partial [Planctomycetes bacterium]|nr:DNA repair protein RadC [Planctomycetota bacterium]
EGVGPRRAERVAAGLALAGRLLRERRPERPRLRVSQDVFACLHLEMRDLGGEVFEVLSLDARNRLRRRSRISVGTLTASLVHPREVFRPAIAVRAAAIVLAHNHPSGDPEPSAEDRAITDRVVSAGDILGIRVLDHVVVGDGVYVSFADRGWI